MYTNYQSPFSWRYGSEEMRQIFSEQHKYELWRSVWVALATIQHKAGLVSNEELADLQKHEHNLDIKRILEIEKDTKHDVVAAIKEFSEKCIVGGGKIHFGATSMDISDNAETLRIREALHVVQQKVGELLLLFSAQMIDKAQDVCMGYTHLQPAEPTTVGYRLAFYAQDLLIDYQHIKSLLDGLKGKGLKGAVGTRASYQELLEGTSLSAEDLDALVMKHIGLESVLIATQVSTRKYDYLVATVLASVASSMAKFASDLRILQSPAFGEWSEPFGNKQVGSSAMPFKKNPVNSEKICSLARYVTQLPPVLLENATLSHLERTLDDSANRRIVISELFLAVDEIMETSQKIVKGLVFHTERIHYNLNQFAPFSATESILIALVKRGADRQVMHELLKTLSLASWEDVQKGKHNPMIKLLEQSEEIKKFIPTKELKELFDVSKHVGDVEMRIKKLAKQIDLTVE